MAARSPVRPGRLPLSQEMSPQERFARAFFTLKSSLGAGAAWDFWKRLSESKPAAVIAKGDAKKVEATLKSAFSEAWTAAGPNAKTKKAKLAAKKTPAQVGARGPSVLQPCWGRAQTSLGCPRLIRSEAEAVEQPSMHVARLLFVYLPGCQTNGLFLPAWLAADTVI